MCGLFSIIDLKKSCKDTSDIFRHKINKALETISHRGPDGRGIWISKTAKAGLGHNRLSIIDLSTGQQPLLNHIDDTHLIVNGEFYNYENIREQFIKEGYRFNTCSDSEILLPLYKKYGTDALLYLRGEFAFCLWDEKQEILFAARDRFGIKPLYYSVHNGYLYLSSEIKALFAAGIPAKWNKNGYITRSFYFGNQTLYEGVHQIPPGHFMLVQHGEITLHKYWDIQYPVQSQNFLKMDENEYVTELRHLIEESIKYRLRSDVNVGVYLSGGIDSSSVLAIASKYSKKALNTFTLCFDDSEECNEASHAELAAKFLGASFNPIKVTQNDIVENFTQSVWHNEAPFFNGHGIAKYILSRAVNNSNVKVILTGEGADEIFGGYPHYQRDMALYNNQDQNKNDINILKNKILKHEASLNLPNSTSFPMVQKFLGFQPSWMQYQAQWMEGLQEMFNKKYKNQFSSNHHYQEFISNQMGNKFIANIDPVHVSMYLWTKSLLPNFVLKSLGDRMEMANSIEGRVALLDHHVAEFATKIPVSLKVNPETTKYIFRKALQPYLPDETFRRKKHYFRAPQALISPNGMLYSFIKDTLSSQHFKSVPFFDHKKVLMFLDNIPKMSEFEQSNYDGILTELTSLTILQEQFSITN